jgi:Putative transposase
MISTTPMDILETEGRRKWNVYVSPLVSKSNVIDHIGRYIRKPPIAQYRLTRIDDHHVQYRVKDTKNRRLTPVIYSNKEFVRDTLIKYSLFTAKIDKVTPA